MIYEIEVFLNNMSDKTEKLIVEGSGFVVTDTVEGSLFSITSATGGPVMVIPYHRLKQMRKISGGRKRSADKPREIKSVTTG